MASNEGANSQKDLLARWRARKKSTATTSSGIPATNSDTPPLSLGQQRLWLLQELHPGNPFYHYTELYRLDGPLEVEIFLQAFDQLCQRHQILRTTFPATEEQPHQVIQAKPNHEVRIQNASDRTPSEVEELVYAEARRPFDLVNGPLTRLLLLRLGAEEYLLVLSMHHIITDKWSMRILRTEWAHYYQSLITQKEQSLAPLRIQYGDYAAWQRTQSIDEQHLAYWQQQLAGEIPILQLPLDRPRKSIPTYAGAFSERSLDPSLSQQLIQLSQEKGTTLFALLLTAFKVLLCRYARQTDILIGTPFTNRDQKELEQLIGFFNDTLVLRSDLSGDPTFSLLLSRVQRTVLDAFAHKNVPFETLVKEISPERDPGLNPLFQTMFLYHDVPESPDFGNGIRLEHKPFDLGVAKFDLTLYISNDQGALSAIVEYATDVFDASTIERLHDHFQQLLRVICKAPDQPISTYTILSEAERKQLLIDWNPTPFGPAFDRHVVHQIAQQPPDQLAVISGAEQLTYGALEERATALAQGLLRAKLGPNPIIGLYTERSPELLIGILGILKAGGAYLPLDPHYPAERIQYMLEDSEAAYLVTQKGIPSELSAWSDRSIAITTPVSPTELLPLPSLRDEQLAYLIYTSGSTGKPKGVAVTHGNLRISTADRFQVYPSNPKQFLLLSSFSFDSSVAGIFWTLCSGGALVLPPRRIEQDLEQLAALIFEQAVSHTLLLPSLYQLLLEHSPAERLRALDTIIVAGEACPVSLPQLHFERLPESRLFNEYGPTEATVWCTVCELQADELSDRVPIGRPTPHAQIYLLDAQREPVPIGVAGELYVGGPGITQGYYRRPALTAERFLPHPFSRDASERLYRTGDLARYRPDGTIDFLGRADQQIKIRGYRIEPDEIRTRLLQLANVQDALIQVQSGPKQTKRLVAYLVADSATDRASIQQALSQQLPEYMVPSAYVLLAVWPRLPNGKIDQRALPAPDEQALASTPDYLAPRTPTEQMLADCWAEVLQLPRVGIHDNFFAIGGDSILSIQIVAKLRQAGLRLKANQLFEHQTISELALYAQQTDPGNDTTEIITGIFPLSPIQEWFFAEHQTAPHYWNQAIRYQLSDRLSEATVATGAERLSQQHDLLRATFTQKGAKWMGYIQPPGEQSFSTYLDLSNRTESEQAQQIETTLRNFQDTLLLSAGPLFQLFYFHCQPQRADQLILLAHHLVVDVVSWQILDRDLNQLLRPEGQALGSKTTAYSEWCNSLQSEWASGTFAEEQAFWIAQTQASTPFPTDSTVELPVAESGIATYQQQLEAATTQQWLETALAVYRLKADEFLIICFLETLLDWKGITNQTLLLERHGREAPTETIDLSNTVGWFTAFFPLRLELNPSDNLANRIKATKEQIRKVPRGGLGYGVLRYLSDSDIHWEHAPATVINYLGQQDGTERTGIGAPEPLFSYLRDPRTERNYLLELNAALRSGKLQLSWSFHQTIHQHDTIEAFAAHFEQTFRRLIDHCLAVDSENYTPSDFPDAELNQDDLDTLLGQIDL